MRRKMCALFLATLTCLSLAGFTTEGAVLKENTSDDLSTFNSALGLDGSVDLESFSVQKIHDGELLNLIELNQTKLAMNAKSAYDGKLSETTNTYKPSWSDRTAAKAEAFVESAKYDGDLVEAFVVAEPKKSREGGTGVGYDMIEARGWEINILEEAMVEYDYNIPVHWFKTSDAELVYNPNDDDWEYHIIPNVTANGIADNMEKVMYGNHDDAVEGINYKEGTICLQFGHWDYEPYTVEDGDWHKARGAVLIDGRTGNALDVSNMWTGEGAYGGVEPIQFPIEYNGETIELTVAGYNALEDKDGDDAYDYGERQSVYVKIFNVPKDYDDLIVGFYSARNDGTNIKDGYSWEAKPSDRTVGTVEYISELVEHELEIEPMVLFQAADAWEE